MFRYFFQWICWYRRTSLCCNRRPSHNWLNNCCYYSNYWYYEYTTNPQYGAQAYLSSSLATFGRCRTCTGQYACLCFYLSSRCSFVEILEHDEKFCQLHSVIYGPLRDYKKHCHQYLSMISQRSKITSRHHQNNFNCRYPYPSESIYRCSTRRRLYHSNVCSWRFAT